MSLDSMPLVMPAVSAIVYSRVICGYQRLVAVSAIFGDVYPVPVLPDFGVVFPV